MLDHGPGVRVQSDFTIAELETQEFTKSATIGAMQDATFDWTNVPDAPGVYVIFRPTVGPHRSTRVGSGPRRAGGRRVARSVPPRRHPRGAGRRDPANAETVLGCWGVGCQRSRSCLLDRCQ